MIKNFKYQEKTKRYGSHDDVDNVDNVDDGDDGDGDGDGALRNASFKRSSLLFFVLSMQCPC